MHEFKLNGLDGSNLLAFMAALGVLRVLSGKQNEVNAMMNWSPGGAWTPTIHHPSVSTEEGLIAALAESVCGTDTANAAWKIANDLTVTAIDFRRRLLECLFHSSREQRSALDFLTAFGSEAIPSGPKKDQISDTEYRTMSGAGNQHFLAFMRELAETSTGEDLSRSLFETWDYHDGRPSMRWNPADYRPHALRAENPSGDPIKTMRGANRLALEALPMFPTAPYGRYLRTVAFADRNGDTEVTWPIWLEPIGIQTASSMLALEELQSADMGEADRKRFNRREITQIFRAKRFTDGQFRNFTPARALL